MYLNEKNGTASNPKSYDCWTLYTEQREGSCRPFPSFPLSYSQIKLINHLFPLKKVVSKQTKNMIYINIGMFRQLESNKQF
jgi:hypothetical protein